LLPDAPPATPGTPLALLQALAALTSRRMPTEHALIMAVLNTIADQLQVRTPFVAGTQAGIFQVIDVVNRQGCTISAGAVRPLPDSY
jgi:hypothetical protein